MTNRFMLSVAAAALIAGTGFANAQGTGTAREAPSAGSAAQQSAPSSDRAGPSSATPMNRNDASDSAAPAAKSAQEEKMQPQGSKNQRTQGDMKAGPKGEKSAQENKDNNMQGEKSKSMSSETNEKGSAGKDMKAEGRNGNTNAESKSTDSKGTAESRSQTTGQAGAGAKLSSDQRTKITSVIRGQHIAPVKNVNFSISVGTRVPRDVSFHPLPEEIVTIYPDWHGYQFILVNDQIVVVDPRTFEIVAVIEA
jgi:Protein of unknown function (DUF1236)